MSKLLFVLKHRDNLYTDEYGSKYNQGGLSSGLLNSASFVIDMLGESDIESKLVQVQDNNCIDREVTLYKPTHVILEAYWCVPEKFAILTKLHPTVKWIIRNHSEMPFLANEGIAINWTLEYLKHPNVFVAANSKRALHDMKIMAEAAHGEAGKNRIMYLPNYYTFTDPDKVAHKKDNDVVNVGCFGAIRPLKNQLIQAIAAIEFAKKVGKKLRFHINSSRIEGNGNNVLKNIRALFEQLGDEYELIEHGWMPRKEFVRLCAKMDIAMAVSFTETFCIVAADMVSMDIPIVVSHDILWASRFSKADPTSTPDIVNKMRTAYALRKLHVLQLFNKVGLEENIAEAKSQWELLFK